MPTTIVHVEYRGGTPASGIPVNLYYDRWTEGGVTRTVRTDRGGTARIDHTVTGTATLFVDHKDHGTISTPGEQRVTL